MYEVAIHRQYGDARSPVTMDRWHVVADTPQQVAILCAPLLVHATGRASILTCRRQSLRQERPPWTLREITRNQDASGHLAPDIMRASRAAAAFARWGTTPDARRTPLAQRKDPEAVALRQANAHNRRQERYRATRAKQEERAAAKEVKQATKEARHTARTTSYLPNPY